MLLTIQQTDLSLLHKEEFRITSVNRKKINKPFDSFATDPHGKGLPSIYNVLEKLSQTSLKLFCMLAKVRDYNTNEAVLLRQDLDPKEDSVVNRGYKQLKELNLVIRVRDQTYLFNPDYLIPNLKKEDAIKKRYENSKKG